MTAENEGKAPGLRVLFCCLLVLLPCGQIWSQQSSASRNAGEDRLYRLGPDDQVAIRVADLEKLQLDNAEAPRIDVNGELHLPLIGQIHAAGMTVAELESAISAKLQSVLQHPNVSVRLVQYRNHPVSVLGAVRNPGVIQMTRGRNLLEVISMAGGLAEDAGDKVKISRPMAEGAPPLPAVAAEGGYYVGSVDVHSLMQASNPKLNIEVVENDVVTVPRAELIYVMGAVKKAGGFTLGEKERVSVIQAISMAEGFDRAAALSSARLLRDEGQKERTETVINLKPIMAGKSPDLYLRANDILYVPTSTTKLVSIRGLETAVQLGTGLAIWR